MFTFNFRLSSNTTIAYNAYKHRSTIVYADTGLAVIAGPLTDSEALVMALGGNTLEDELVDEK